MEIENTLKLHTCKLSILSHSRDDNPMIYRNEPTRYGAFHKYPTVGHRFYFHRADGGYMLTSPVVEILGGEKKNEIIFKTENSTYKIELL